MNILEIHGLYKSFAKQQVLKGVDLIVPEHCVFGFIGQNGAGKTTTMKSILGLLKMDKGSIKICGENVVYGETKTNRFIGYLSDVPEFYSFMNSLEYLNLCGKITKMSSKDIKERSEQLLQLVGLWDMRKKRIGGFSRGMKQRLGIAQALLHEPKLLICDEPTSALDPIGRKEILDILLKVKDHTTVLFSTHVLSDVERICDNIAILHDGKIALNGTLEDIQKKHKSDAIAIEFLSQQDMQVCKAAISNSSEIISTKQLLIHTSDVIVTQQQIMNFLSSKNIVVQKLEILEPSLESLFMEVVQ